MPGGVGLDGARDADAPGDGVAGGVFADVDDAVDRCVRVTSTVEPDPAWHEAYRAAHERYRALYPALRAVRVPA